MSVNKLLLWEKWRPKKLEDIILLPRIRSEFENGVNQHYIFHGHYGTGKTSLARILIGKYSKETPYIEFNCSMDTSIELLRTEIDNFCKFTPMMDTDSDIKFVFLDEFERVSPNFQDAFKAFIEKYNKSVRFIITTNHIGKITEGLKSRIKQVNFDVQSVIDEKFLKNEIYKKLLNVILPAENYEIPVDSLKSIITKKFPDFRSIIVDVQSYIDSGSLSDSSSNISSEIKNELYSFLYTDVNFEQTYHFLMSKFGAEKIDVLIKLLGKPFIDWCIAEKKQSVDKLFKISYILSDYSSKLESSTDPIILGITIIGKIKDILNN